MLVQVQKKSARASLACDLGGVTVPIRVFALASIVTLSLFVSGCTSCGQFDKFNAPTMPKLCHADNPPN
jgi:hypothetical protein